MLSLVCLKFIQFSTTIFQYKATIIRVLTDLLLLQPEFRHFLSSSHQKLARHVAGFARIQDALNSCEFSYVPVELGIRRTVLLFGP